MLSVIRTSLLRVNAITVPSILSQWLQGIVLAAPKKKTTHSKKRSRMLGGWHLMKNAQPWNNLNKCPSCGHYKRAHTLCMYCVGQIRYIWKNQLIKESKKVEGPVLDEIDRRIIYPEKCDTPYMKKLKDKDSYLERRKRTLPVDEQ